MEVYVENQFKEKLEPLLDQLADRKREFDSLKAQVDDIKNRSKKNHDNITKCIKIMLQH